MGKGTDDQGLRRKDTGLFYLHMLSSTGMIHALLPRSSLHSSHLTLTTRSRVQGPILSDAMVSNVVTMLLLHLEDMMQSAYADFDQHVQEMEDQFTMQQQLFDIQMMGPFG